MVGGATPLLEILVSQPLSELNRRFKTDIRS